MIFYAGFGQNVMMKRKKFVEVPEGKPLHVSISFPLDSHNTAKTTLKLPQTNNLETTGHKTILIATRKN